MLTAVVLYRESASLRLCQQVLFWITVAVVVVRGMFQAVHRVANGRVTAGAITTVS